MRLRMAVDTFEFLNGTANAIHRMKPELLRGKRNNGSKSIIYCMMVMSQKDRRNGNRPKLSTQQESKHLSL